MALLLARSQHGVALYSFSQKPTWPTWEICNLLFASHSGDRFLAVAVMALQAGLRFLLWSATAALRARCNASGRRGPWIY